SGVFQYDYGRTVQNQAFQETQHLDKAPKVLRQAVSGIKTQHHMYGHNIQNIITTALNKIPRIKKNHSSPGPDLDKLYLPTVIHPFSNDSPCDVSCGADNSLLVSRPKRDPDNNNPVIHYGLITTANQVIKDATIRDKLARERDVLCFEMESGGLMNRFPCLVVRGICDYADTHKNKTWQGYAAMTAAAYAKSLLQRIQPGSEAAAEKLSDLLQDVLIRSAKILSNQVLSLSHTAATGITHLNTSFRHDKITKWLSPPNYQQNFDTGKSKHEASTGQWLLDSKEYQPWKTDPSSSLWLHGNTGCGKTILSYTVVADLEQDKLTSEAFLFFYFDFTDVGKQSTENALCSLVVQLYDKREEARAPLDELFEKRTAHRKPDYPLLKEVFRSMVKRCRAIWIVLDALDECNSRGKENGNSLLSWMENLRCACSNVHVFFTSRPEPDIKQSIEAWHNCNEISLRPDLMAQDIETYVHRRVSEMILWQDEPRLQEVMRDTLIQGAQGMFRWVACQFETLQKCLSQDDVEYALKHLPRTLNETYSRMLESIEPLYKRHSIRILQFLTYSDRALRIEEAVDAVAVRLNETTLFKPTYRLKDPKMIVCYCPGFAVLEETYDQRKEKQVVEIRLAHLSVQGYFKSNQLNAAVSGDFE
ncbi:hypothetical protein LLEC1_08050, partial [Akanthomyces lecanii]